MLEGGELISLKPWCNDHIDSLNLFSVGILHNIVVLYFYLQAMSLLSLLRHASFCLSIDPVGLESHLGTGYPRDQQISLKSKYWYMGYALTTVLKYRYNIKEDQLVNPFNQLTLNESNEMSIDLFYLLNASNSPLILFDRIMSWAKRHQDNLATNGSKSLLNRKKCKKYEWKAIYEYRNDEIQRYL